MLAHPKHCPRLLSRARNWYLRQLLRQLLYHALPFAMVAVTQFISRVSGALTTAVHIACLITLWSRQRIASSLDSNSRDDILVSLRQIRFHLASITYRLS